MTRRYKQYDETTLVELVLAGEREAFTPLVERYYPGILRLCIRLLGPIHEAEDMAQEAVLQAYLGLAKLRDRDKPGAWMYAIAANQCRSILRRTKPVSVTSLDDIRDPVCRQPDAETLAADRELHRLIMEAIDSLSDINQDVVIGFYLEGYSYQELEHLLDIPVDTVRSRLFKARQNLRKKLSPIIQDYMPDTKLIQEKPMKASDQLKVEIEHFAEKTMIDETDIIFKVIDKEQYLGLRLTQEEGKAIESAMRMEPATHNLTYQLLERMGGKVDRILINHLVGQQCTARITVLQDEKTHILDVRVGEAVALALMCESPIYATSEAIDMVGVSFHVDRKSVAEQDDDLYQPYTKDPVRQDMLYEYVWRMIMGVKFGRTDEQMITVLKNEPWEKLFPAREVTWEGQTVTAIEVAYDNPRDTAERKLDKIWVMVPSYVWAFFTEDVVKPLKEMSFPSEPLSTQPDPPLDKDLVGQIDAMMSQAFQQLESLGIPTIALMSRNGKMISGYSELGMDEAETLGINAVRQNRVWEYRERMASMTSGWRMIYNRGNIEGLQIGLKRDDYKEAIHSGGWGNINGHWVLVYVGFEKAGSDGSEANMQFRKLASRLKDVLPDVSDRYSTPNMV